MTPIVAQETILPTTTAEEILNQDIVHSIETLIGSLPNVSTKCPRPREFVRSCVVSDSWKCLF